MLLPWLLETRLVCWKTGIEGAHMVMLDGIDTQFTSKWIGSDIVQENYTYMGIGKLIYKGFRYVRKEVFEDYEY